MSDDYTLSDDEFETLIKIFRLQQAKRERYINIEYLKNIPRYKNVCKRLRSMDLVGFKKNKCVYITSKGAAYIADCEGIQKRTRLHQFTEIAKNVERR